MPGPLAPKFQRHELYKEARQSEHVLPGTLLHRRFTVSQTANRHLL